MLFFAIAIHMLVILGVTFNPFDDDEQNPPLATMDITLVKPDNNEDKPSEAQYLAQVTQAGGGNINEMVRATQPPQAARKQDSPGVNEVTSLPQDPATQQRDRELLTQDEAPQSITTEQEGRTSRKTTPSAAQLIMRSKEIASLTAEIEQRRQAQSQRPKQKFISASTRELRYATYMESWREKVERIGNLNYPEEAKRRHLSGELILDVALRPDGTVKGVTIRRSSGHKLLDDAAVRIVELAAPFSPFPESIRKETDILHITKTWQFLSGNQLHM
jgi:protein TonB